MQEIQPTHQSDNDDEDDIEPLIKFIIANREYEKCHKNRHHHRESKCTDSHVVDRESRYIAILYILDPLRMHRTENDLYEVYDRVCHPEDGDDDPESEIIHISVLEYIRTVASNAVEIILSFILKSQLY